MYNNKRKILLTLFALVLIVISQSVSPVIGQFFSDMLTDVILIVSVMVLDTVPCAAVAATAPFLQKLLGLTSLPIAILAIISISNIMYITVYTAAFQIFASRTPWQKYFTWGVSILLSSFLKFEIQFITVEKYLIKVLEINSEITYSFGFNQFLSAAAAGFAAMLIIYPIKKKIGK